MTPLLLLISTLAVLPLPHVRSDSSSSLSTMSPETRNQLTHIVAQLLALITEEPTDGVSGEASRPSRHGRLSLYPEYLRGSPERVSGSQQQAVGLEDLYEAR